MLEVQAGHGQQQRSLASTPAEERSKYLRHGLVKLSGLPARGPELYITFSPLESSCSGVRSYLKWLSSAEHNAQRRIQLRNTAASSPRSLWNKGPCHSGRSGQSPAASIQQHKVIPRNLFQVYHASSPEKDRHWTWGKMLLIQLHHLLCDLELVI